MDAATGPRRLTRVETFARAGHAARGVVYVLLGFFALNTAGGEGTRDVLQRIHDMPLGRVLLVVVGLGLAGWGIFRLFGAAVDIQGKGTDLKGAGTRAGHALSGLAHLVLCFFALRLATGGGSGAEEGAAKASAAATASSLPMGEALIVLVGIGFGLAALNQFKKAATGDFMKLLDSRAPDWTEVLGRTGYAARGFVFGALAWQIIEIALAGGSAEEAGIGGALEALRQVQWLFIAVAIGLILFGVFSLVMARYRLIQDHDLLERLKRAI